ncbi:hypothetical protein HMPREF7215_1231 [Pyramidobacter piscolens W5455]|uniref:Uncharacterized protein n=1 Tax=Pyramidobacter piscolens W5455 TaxID=352165 RepID=A0ABP2HVZ3_9BACT|nr:hypothetical protein HMPREF7215_1231 [Pyramidobacter piscolens W5455]
MAVTRRPASTRPITSLIITGHGGAICAARFANPPRSAPVFGFLIKNSISPFFSAQRNRRVTRNP